MVSNLLHRSQKENKAKLSLLQNMNIQVHHVWISSFIFRICPAFICAFVSIATLYFSAMEGLQQWKEYHFSHNM